MNIQDAIAKALRETGHAVRLNTARQEDVAPYIVFSIVAGSDEVALSGPTGQCRRIVQVDAWADKPSTAYAMIASAVDKMANSPKFDVDAIDVSGAPDYEPDTKLSRESRDFTIYFEP